MWWLYFDVVALVRRGGCRRADVGRGRTRIARDSYSYLHFPMVAGIVPRRAGAEEDPGADLGTPLEAVAAVALLGGLAVYLLGLVGFRYRHAAPCELVPAGSSPWAMLAGLVVARGRPGRPGGCWRLITVALWALIA